MSQGGRTPGKLKENEIGSASGRDNGLAHIQCASLQSRPSASGTSSAAIQSAAVARPRRARMERGDLQGPRDSPFRRREGLRSRVGPDKGRADRPLEGALVRSPHPGAGIITGRRRIITGGGDGVLRVWRSFGAVEHTIALGSTVWVIALCHPDHVLVGTYRGMVDVGCLPDPGFPPALGGRGGP